MQPACYCSSSEKAANKLPVHRTRYQCALANQCEYPWACDQLNTFMDELEAYRMLPSDAMTHGEVHPSLCYGVVHLLRLFGESR
jgi:hypothetical protein